MCDYSLESIAKIDAAKDVEYTLGTFGSAFGSKGFKADENTAACVLEGAVLRIDVPQDMQYDHGLLAKEDVVMIRLDSPTYKDAVKFEGGLVKVLQYFPVGTRATVLVTGDAKAPEDKGLATSTADSVIAYVD